MTDKSTLAEQREKDEALCEDLVDEMWHEAWGGEMPYNPKWSDMCRKASQRITDLSEQLREACHDRDGMQARAERAEEAERAAVARTLAFIRAVLEDEAHDEPIPWKVRLQMVVLAITIPQKLIRSAYGVISDEIARMEPARIVEALKRGVLSDGR